MTIESLKLFLSNPDSTHIFLPLYSFIISCRFPLDRLIPDRKNDVLNIYMIIHSLLQTTYI